MFLYSNSFHARSYVSNFSMEGLTSSLFHWISSTTILFSVLFCCY
nr:MAG TPA: hypothetical protein [Caudoviricetes sp.]